VTGINEIFGEIDFSRKEFPESKYDLMQQFSSEIKNR
jgi:hypothetical protein